MFKLSGLLPKENEFCRLLDDLSDQAMLCATHLKIYVSNSDAPGEAAENISESRTRAKTIMAEITRELCLKFITPFDREDIQDLAVELYKIPKTIQKVVERMELHGLRGSGDFTRQVDVILQEAEAMDAVIKDMTRGRNKEGIQERIGVLYDLEQTGDEVVDELLAALFKTDYDVKEFILRKDIYDMLEKIIDRYRNAAGVALQVVLKYS